MLRNLIVLFIMLGHLTANAESQLNLDFIAAGASDSSTAQSGISIRTTGSLLFDLSDFYVGPTVSSERPNDSIITYVFGAAMSIGEDLFFQFGAGYLIISTSLSNEKGFAFTPQIGKNFELSQSVFFRVSIPVVIKLVTSGTPERTLIDYVPYIGFQFRL